MTLTFLSHWSSYLWASLTQESSTKQFGAGDLRQSLAAACRKSKMGWEKGEWSWWHQRAWHQSCLKERSRLTPYQIIKKALALLPSLPSLPLTLLPSLPPLFPPSPSLSLPHSPAQIFHSWIMRGSKLGKTSKFPSVLVTEGTKRKTRGVNDTSDYSVT